MRQIDENESEDYLSYICYRQNSAYFVVVYCKTNMSIFVTVATNIGSGCDFNEQCSANLGAAVCEGNQCRCAEGASLNNNTCGKLHT